MTTPRLSALLRGVLLSGLLIGSANASGALVTRTVQDGSGQHTTYYLDVSGTGVGPFLPVTAGLDTNGNVIPAGGSAGTAGDTSITAGGTAQNIFGGTTPVNGWTVINPNLADDLWCSDSGTAVVNGQGSLRIGANGGTYETPTLYKPVGVVSCIGPTTGDKITARRW